MATTDLHVNGPALTGLSFGNSSFNNFGYTENGVEVTFDEFHEDVITDDYGPSMPGDVQAMGSGATIRMNMVRWDQSIANQLAGIIASGSQGNYAMASIGTLYFAGSQYIGVRYTSSQRTGLALEPYRTFPYCHITGSFPLTVGTRVSRWSFTFRAVMRDGVLYTVT